MASVSADASAPTGSRQPKPRQLGLITWLGVKLIIVFWLLLEPTKVVVIEYQQF